MSTTIEHSEQLGELTKALVAAQAEFPAIPKTSENPFFKSKYADLADVKAITVPITTKHGLAVTQHPSHNDRGDTLVTMLLHTSGQFIKAEMELHLAKTDAQGQGSALTYARRYAYMAALDLVADEDDDGHQASQPQRNRSGGKPKAQTSARQSQPQPTRTVDSETGEIQEAPNVSEVIGQLSQEGRKQLLDKMRAANFPDVQPNDLAPGAQKQVIKWAEEIKKAKDAGAPF
jgi:hypothetical protein